MAYRDRSLQEDIKKNIIDVGLKGDITTGDRRRYVKTKPDTRIEGVLSVFQILFK